MLEILSPNKYQGRLSPIRYVVVHTMEVDEADPNVAEAVARAFQAASREASAHVCVDTDSEVRCVADADTAWAAPGANASGLQIELAGRAGQSASDWQDPASQAILGRAARVCADWAAAYGIPLTHLSVAQLQGGVDKGFIGHVDATYAFRKSDHTDPGSAFPWAQFLAMVAGAAGGAAPVVPASTPVLVNLTLCQGSTGSAVVRLQQFLGISADGVFGPQTDAAVRAYQAGVGLGVDGVVGPLTWAKITAGVRPTTAASSPAAPAYRDITGVQRAVHCTPDNIWGPITDRNVDAVRKASVWGGQQFPYGVRYAQSAVGAVADGVWGPASRAAHDATVAAVQRAVGATPDGVWGPDTQARVQAAYAAARRA